MGRLADCLAKLGIEGDQAEAIRGAVSRQKGIGRTNASKVQALIKEARENRRSVLQQLSDQLDKPTWKAVFEKKPAQDEALPDWVTDDDAYDSYDAFEREPGMDDVEAERTPLSKEEQKELAKEIRRIRKEAGDEAADELAAIDPVDAHGIIKLAKERQDISDGHLSELESEYDRLFDGGERQYRTYFTKDGKKVVRKDGTGARRSKKAKEVERSGGDETNIPGFDEFVQLVRDGGYPNLHGRATQLGDGDLGHGLYQILQAGKTGLAGNSEKHQHLFELLDEYQSAVGRTAQESGRSNEADGGGEVEQVGGDQESGAADPAQEAPDDFQLTGVPKQEHKAAEFESSDKGRQATFLTGSKDIPGQEVLFDADGVAEPKKDPTTTPAFKKWFGSSKVVGPDGKPLVVYHTTANDFTEFKAGGDNVAKSGAAIWLGTDPLEPPAAHNTSRRKGDEGPKGRFRDGTRTIPAYVRIERPLIIDDDTREWAKAVYGKDVPYLLPPDVVRRMKEDGYDGVLLYRPTDKAPSGKVFRPSGLTEIIAFDPGQIKSAAANKGEYSREDASILAASARGPLLRPLPKSAAIEPKSQRQIIADIAKGLKVPVRFGRLLSKSGGHFLPVQNLIAAARANDVPVVSHEAGHKLDQMFGFSKDKAIASELNVLGDPTTPNSRSSWTKSKSLAYKRGEGVAEFVRYWLTEPEHALKVAPNTHAAFEAVLNANKDLADTLRQAQEDIRLWRTAEPQARLRSQISIGDNPNKTRYSLDQATRDLVDDLHYLRLATDDAIKAKPDLPASKQPYLLARNLRGSYGMADTFVRSGVADFKSKEVKIGTSLEDALKPIAGRINDFRDWIVAKRAQELHKQGRETGLVPEDVKAVAKKFDGDKDFEKAFADIKAWNDAVLKYAVDAGLVTKGAAAAMRQMNQDYVPFHRLFEVGADEPTSQETGGHGSGLNPGKPGSLKRMKGSTRTIVDPIETMIKNAYAVITASEKAAISLAVADMAKLPNMGKWVERVKGPSQAISIPVDRIRQQLEDAGADLSELEDGEIVTFFRTAAHPAFGENTIRVIRDGKPEFYRLNRYLHDTFLALDLDDAGKIIKFISAPAQLLRAGVVLEPSFNLANAFRDTFGAAVLSKYGAVPFETTLRGVAALINKPKLVAEWAASGGRSAVEASYFDRKKMQAYLAEKISKELTPAEQATIILKSPLTALRWMATQFEEATRIGEYEKAYKALTKSGMPEGDARRVAAFEARDRQDFAKGGAKTKILRHSAAFWNAQLQANVRLAQAFKTRPLQTTLAGLAFVTLPKLLEQALNWDDEDYWDRPQWERDLFFLIPYGKDESGHTKFIRLPTPFEIGVVFGTAPGRMLAWAKKNDPGQVADLPGLILKQSIPNPLPQTITLVGEVAAGEQGWSFWRSRPIVPDSLADLPVDLQWTEQSSRLAKAVGKSFGISPLKIDYIIESTTGGLGKVFSGRQTPGKRFFTTPLAVSSQTIEDFYRIREELREDSARLKATGETKGLGPVMLKEFEAVGEKVSAIRQKAKEASEEEAAKLQEEAYQLTKELVSRYRQDAEPGGASAEFALGYAEKVLKDKGRPKRKLGEPADAFKTRTKEWEDNEFAAARDWLKSHKSSTIVQQAVKDAFADIPPRPSLKGSGFDATYGKRVKAWNERYGDSKKLFDELTK